MRLHADGDASRRAGAPAGAGSTPRARIFDQRLPVAAVVAPSRSESVGSETTISGRAGVGRIRPCRRAASGLAAT